MWLTPTVSRIFNPNTCKMTMQCCIVLSSSKVEVPALGLPQLGSVAPCVDLSIGADGCVPLASPPVLRRVWFFRSLSVGCRCVSGFTFIHSFAAAARAEYDSHVLGTKYCVQL